MAGKVSITSRCKRVTTVRPDIEFIKIYINFVHDGPSEVGAEKVGDAQMEEEGWKIAKEKIEELETKVAEQFEDENEKQTKTPLYATLRLTLYAIFIAIVILLCNSIWITPLVYQLSCCVSQIVELHISFASQRK